jgi:autotransporter-associated beta strand protein
VGVSPTAFFFYMLFWRAGAAVHSMKKTIAKAKGRRSVTRGSAVSSRHRLHLEHLEQRAVLTSAFLSGEWGWVGSLYAYKSDVASDANGNMFVVGNAFSYADYNGPIDFDLGPADYNIQQSGSAFLAKYGAQGDFLWVRVFTVGYGGVSLSDVEIASDGAVRVIGSALNQHTWSSSTLAISAPQAAAQTLNSVGPGENQRYACSFSSDGSFEWFSVVPRSVASIGRAVLDPYTNSLMIGYDSQSLYSVTTEGFVQTTPLPYRRLSDLGGTAGAVSIDRVGFDNRGSMFLAGRLRGGADFDPSTNSFDLYSTFEWSSSSWQQIRQWSDDIFVAKYSAFGDFEWVKLQGVSNISETLEQFAVSNEGATAIAVGTSSYSSSRTITSYSPSGASLWTSPISFDSSTQGLVGLAYDKVGALVLLTPTGFMDVVPAPVPRLLWRDRVENGSIDGGHYDALGRAIVWRSEYISYGGSYQQPWMNSSVAFPRVGPGNYFAVLTEVNTAPAYLWLTASTLNLNENTPVESSLKLADISVGDDTRGTNVISLSGADAASFEISGTGLYLKAGTSLDYETKASYAVTVSVRDATVEGSPPASENFVVSITDVLDDYVVEDAASVFISTLPSSTLARVVKRGPGTLIFDKANSYTGGTVVEAGEVVIRNIAALGAGTLEVKAGARVTIDIGSANWNSGTNYLSLPRLVLDPAGRVDVRNGQIRIPAGGYDATAIRSLLILGRNGGTWDGAAGFTSALAGPGTSRAIGYRIMPNNNELRLGFAALGDANVDGQVNLTDVSLINNGRKFGQGPSTGAVWVDGDFNYSGGVNLTDISLLNNAQRYGKGSYLPPSPSSLSSATGSTAISSDAWVAYAVTVESQPTKKNSRVYA